LVNKVPTGLKVRFHQYQWQDICNQIDAILNRQLPYRNI